MAKRRQEIDCEACYTRTDVIYEEAPPIYCPVCGEKQEELSWSGEELNFDDE